MLVDESATAGLVVPHQEGEGSDAGHPSHHGSIVLDSGGGEEGATSSNHDEEPDSHSPVDIGLFIERVVNSFSFSEIFSERECVVTQDQSPSKRFSPPHFTLRTSLQLI